MSIPNAMAQEDQDCELICQFLGVSPSILGSFNPNEVEEQKKAEMEMMAQKFRQIKKERSERRWNTAGALVLAATGIIAVASQGSDIKNQEAMSRSQTITTWTETQGQRPKDEFPRQYADNTQTSRQNSGQQYYSVGTTANAQIESSKQLENLAITNGQSRYVSDSEMQQMKSQAEGTIVIGMEITGYGRISHTLKVDYSRSIPRVNAVRINNPNNSVMDWQYFFIDAEPNRAGMPKECRWLVRINNRIIYF